MLPYLSFPSYPPVISPTRWCAACSYILLFAPRAFLIFFVFFSQVLKIVGADLDCLVDMIRTLAEDGSAMEYARIMSLKGIPKKDQQVQLRKLGKTPEEISQCTRAIDTSAITDVGDKVTAAASSVVGRVFGRK